MEWFVDLGPEESWLPSQSLEAPPCQRPSFNQGSSGILPAAET